MTVSEYGELRLWPRSAAEGAAAKDHRGERNLGPMTSSSRRLATAAWRRGGTIQLLDRDDGGPGVAPSRRIPGPVTKR